MGWFLKASFDPQQGRNGKRSPRDAGVAIDEEESTAHCRFLETQFNRSFKLNVFKMSLGSLQARRA